MKNVRFLFGLMVCAAIACAGQARAQWSEPQLLAELNDGDNIANACVLSADKLTIYFGRQIPALGHKCIVEAYRNEPNGPFTSERILTELPTTGEHLNGPWVTPDALRLYYHEVVDGEAYIKMAQRSTTADLWTPVKTFPELHADGYHDASPTLTADELIIVWQSGLTSGAGNQDLYVASRSNRDEPFSRVRAISEISTPVAEGSAHLLPDGLTIYFNRAPEGGRPTSDIFRATRESRSDPFGNATLVTFPHQSEWWETSEYVTPEEDELYLGYANGIYLARRPRLELRILGPEETVEDFATQYQCVLLYNESQQNVTADATWSVEPEELAIIVDGRLHVGDIDTTTILTVRAKYGPAHAQKRVLVNAYSPTGNALQFDGLDDFVRIPYQPELNSPDFTAMMWVKPGELIDEYGAPLSTRHVAQISPLNARAEGYNLYLHCRPEPNVPRWEFWTGTGKIGESGLHDVLTAPLQDTAARTHVAISYKVASGPDTYGMYLGTKAIYINGKLAASGSHRPFAPNYSGDCYLGKTVALRQNWHFAGMIDEVQLYDRALPSEKIQEIMNSAATGDGLGLVACWNLDEGEGQVAHDLSPHCFHGQLGANPTETDDSDPAWITWHAIGEFLLSPDLALFRLEKLMPRKAALAREIEALLAQETDANILLETLLAEKGPDPDVTAAQQHFNKTRTYDHLAAIDVDHSIASLENTLAALAGDPVNSDDDILVEEADVNADGEINLLDFAWLNQYWLQAYTLPE